MRESGAAVVARRRARYAWTQGLGSAYLKVLTAANSGEIHATYEGFSAPLPERIGDPIHVSVTMVIVGGTGRFENASGTADMTAAVTFEGFSDRSWAGRWEWNGTITYSEATDVLRELQRLSSERYVGALPFALVHQGLGDIDTALDWYARAFDDHERIIAFSNVDPVVDELRSDPRFAGLVRRLQLPAERVTEEA